MKLTDLRKLAEGRTKGGWWASSLGSVVTMDHDTLIARCFHHDCKTNKPYEDGNFIAAMANHIDALLDVAEAADAMMEAKLVGFEYLKNADILCKMIAKLEAIE